MNDEIVKCPECKGKGKKIDGVYVSGMLGLPLLMDYEGCFDKCKKCGGNGILRIDKRKLRTL